MKFLNPFKDHLYSLLRLMTGLLFLQHGTTKFLSFPVTKYSGVDPFSLIGAAGMVELVGGALVAVGLFTRPAAFVCSGTMAVAYFHEHFPISFFPILNWGELAVLYCFAFLYIAAAGGGKWSLDALRSRAP